MYIIQLPVAPMCTKLEKGLHSELYFSAKNLYSDVEPSYTESNSIRTICSIKHPRIFLSIKNPRFVESFTVVVVPIITHLVIHKCALGNDCNLNADCADTEDSYNCTCKIGYAGNGVTCDNIDECTTGEHTCDDNQVCADTVGSYTCTCKAGYVGNGITCDVCVCGVSV